MLAAVVLLRGRLGAGLDVLAQLVHFVVVVGPLGDDPASGIELRLFGQGIVAQIDGFGLGQLALGAPRLTVKPFLWQGKDWNLMDHVIWQVLKIRIR